MATQEELEPSTAAKILSATFWIAVILIAALYGANRLMPHDADALQGVSQTPATSASSVPTDTPSAAVEETAPVIKAKPSETPVSTPSSSITFAVPVMTAPAPATTPSAKPSATAAAPAPNKTDAVATARRAWCSEHSARVAAYNAYGAMSTNRLADSPWAKETKTVLARLYGAYTEAGGKPEPVMSKYTGPLGHIIGQQWLKCGP